MFDRIRNIYGSFRRLSVTNNRKRRGYFIYYLYLRKRYGVAVEDFFKYELYDRRKSHEDYDSSNLKITRSWRVAARKYRPPKCGRVRIFFYHVDYLVSKLLYPGLDAMDYLSYEFYNFRYAKRKTFVTEGYLKVMDRALNGADTEASNILRDKASFNEHFDRFVHRRWLRAETMTRETFSAFCEGLREVIVKPLDGAGGHGIYKAPVETEEAREALYHDVQMGGGKYILEEVIRQHRDVARFNPSSVNTYRIYSCIDGQGEIMITRAAIRIGGGNGPTDNYHQGGYVATVDYKTGIVVSHAINFNGDPVYVHPLTGCQITGAKLPEWDRAIDMVKEAHKMIPDLGYVAWDAVACEDSSVALIEANTLGGVDVQQHPSLSGVKPIYDQIIQQRKRK